MPGLRSLDGAQPAALQGLRERSLAVAAPAPRPIFHPALWRSGPAEPVELRGVSKVFTAEGSPGFAALSGIDLALPPGSANLVEGPSGSGKTTLLGLIACLVRPTEGRLRIGGREATRLPEEQLAALRRRQFGFVFQSDHLIRGTSALDNVIVPALPGPGGDAQPGSSGSSRWPDDPRRRGRELLARLGLERRADERVERLSGGERQRVAIARALINDPPCLLADEPTAHLDRTAAERFLELLEELADAGRTLIVASHDPLVCASPVFSHAYALRDGRLLGRSGPWS